MENASLENVSIELTQRSQSRGDEIEYSVSSIFEDTIELETALETQQDQSCLTSGISANINSRQPARRIAQAGATVRLSLPRETVVRDSDKSSAAVTGGALTSNRGCQRVQPDHSIAYQSASLDDVNAVPNSVTCSLRRHGIPKEGEEAVQKEDDTTKEQNSSPKRSVTINFRLTEDQFCCSSRESSLHLELDVGNYEGTKNREAFPPQVICQEQARKTARDAVLRVTSTLVISSGSTEEGIVDLHRSPRSVNQPEMDDTDDFQGSSTHEEPDTPEYSPTDSESSETSDEADTMERDANRSGSQSELEIAAAEESNVVGSEEVVNEENGESCVNHLEDTSDIKKSNTNERHSFEENMLNLGAEGVEKCKQSSKENLDENSMLSGTSLDSEANSKTTVVCKNALNKAEPDKILVNTDQESPLSDTIKDNDEKCNETKMIPNDLHKEGFNSGEKACSVDENRHTEPPLEIEADKESIDFDIHSETVDDERVLCSEILSDSEEQGFTFYGKDNLSITKEEKTITKAPDDLPQADIDTSTDGETQGQGDTSYSPTDDSTSDGPTHLKTSSTEELLEETKNERTVSNGEETQLKLPKTLEHVSEVPRGIFESILYKLYNRMNERSPRTRRDISRGPCVKQLVKEFSKEAMDCPKFPKSQSVQVQKTQEQIPKSQLFESLSDINDSARNHSAQEQKILEGIPKSQLFESFSDIDDRGFETRLETSTDEDLLSSDDVPIRSSTPSQEVVVMEIRDELQKPDCSSKRVIQLIKKFGGKGSFKKHKNIEDKIVKTEQHGEAQLPAEDVDQGCVNKDVTTDDKSKNDPVGEMLTACSRKGSSAWLTNVSVKNLVAIFSEISKSPVLSRRSTSRPSNKCAGRQGRETSTKPSRTMETQTPGSEPIASCSNVLLLVQPEYNGSNMLSSRFERKRSTLSMCLPLVEPEDYEAGGSRPAADALRACASATGLLLVSTAEPVRVRALCSPDDNHAALSQLAHLLHMPDRRAPGRSRSVARDSSVVRQLVAQWDRSCSN